MTQRPPQMSRETRSPIERRQRSRYPRERARSPRPVRPSRRQRCAELGKELIGWCRSRWRKLSEERIYLGGCPLQCVRVVLLRPFQDAAGDLFQGRALRDPGDLEHLGDLQVLVTAAPLLRLDAERADGAAHAARIQANESGGLRKRWERAHSVGAWMGGPIGTLRSQMPDPPAHRSAETLTDESFVILSCNGGPKWHLPAVAIVALGLLLSGCGGSQDTTRAKDEPVRGGAAQQSSRATARSGGLAVTLTATPGRAKTGSPVEFNLNAYAPHAPGAIGYQLRYGDGTSTAQNIVPLICVAGRNTPTRQTWHLTHRYKAAGRYRVSVSVYVNCTSEHAMATVAVSIA